MQIIAYLLCDLANMPPFLELPQGVPLRSRVRAEGRQLPCTGPSAAVTVELGCDVLDKGAVWPGLPWEW